MPNSVIEVEEAPVAPNSLVELESELRKHDVSIQHRYQDYRQDDRIQINHPFLPEEFFTFIIKQVVGSGSFGHVFNAKCVETAEVVAIKKVFQDRRYKNRELEIMKELHHVNVVKLFVPFYTNANRSDGVFLNLVMEYFPENLARIIRYYSSNHQTIHMKFIKLYTYQMLRGLAYCHALGICHRDIKPHNILVNPSTGRLVVCDFGSAKKLVPTQNNVYYISSRYYRAPELIFQASKYSFAIDAWSAGCVFAEMISGQVLFHGQSQVELLINIIRLLGVPSKADIRAMNPEYRARTTFPSISTTDFKRFFRVFRASDDAIDLLAKLLVYDPHTRISTSQALLHPFFDELRSPDFSLPQNHPLPPLFDFCEAELQMYSPNEIEKLIPPHAKN
eukprot:TRINITY_DN2919_c0_g1_i2.p1 TRINITY_DN2919_c0_g1~~TRINITY_DN2919_c0_g1_i2.p1  ORF type:complete len:391 (-),score=93.22 TRINITY_DN2919_c0_g1_i2:118-1290(-)